ncbi:MAG TPA: hypothetical protein VK348_02665 [Planctomycetota bacterium]|nr:hypothetical protein [Planctomycetota bacterium]
MPAQRHIWIVDPSAGPGTNFTDVQAAADAAQPGDVLRLRSNRGYLGPLTTDKPLLLLTDPGQTPTLGLANLHDLPAGTTFVLAGVALGFPYGSTPSIRLSACQGQVVLRDLRSFFPFPGDPGFAIDASDCRSIDVLRLTTTNSRGLLALRSSVTLLDCWFSIDNYEITPSYGHSMIDAGQSDLSLVDTVCIGGRGNILGGYAMRIVDGLVRIGGTHAGGSFLQAGPGGSRPAVTLLRGAIVFDPAATTIVLGIANAGEVRAEPVPVTQSDEALAGLATATLTAPAGTPALLAFGLPLPPTPTGFGDLRVDLVAGTCALAVGTTSSTGALSTSKQVPSDPNLLGAVFMAQGVAWTSAGVRLTNGAPLVLQ